MSAGLTTVLKREAKIEIVGNPTTLDEPRAPKKKKKKKLLQSLDQSIGPSSSTTISFTFIMPVDLAKLDQHLAGKSYVEG
jgi:hypothetical protein